MLPVIDLDSDNSVDNCAILYSVPRTVVTHIGGHCRPPVKSLTNIVVKKEPVESRALGSPTLWEDFKSPEDANLTHNLYVHKLNVYTLRMVAHSATNIANSSGT